MSLKLSPGPHEPGLRGVLRAVALAALLAGTLGSLGLTLYAGRQNDSRLLLTLFAIWVVSPFVGAVLANAVAMRRPVFARSTLYVAMLVLAVGSLAIYGDAAFGHLGAKLGFVFLVVPLGSWLLLGIVVAVAAAFRPTLSTPPLHQP